MRLYGTLQELTSLVIRLASGKTVKIQADEQTAAGETQITIPNVGDGADELVLKDTAVIMTNKTLTAPVMTSAQIDSSSKIVLPATASPAQTAAGSMVWNSSALLLTVGDGSLSRKVMVDTDSTQTLSGKTLSGGTVASASITNPTMSGVTINSANRIALSSLTTGVGIDHVLISDANGDLDSEPQLSKSRGGTGSILTNVDFPQNVTSKIITNIAELTSAKLDRAAPAIATSVLTPSANKAVVQRIATAANFNEIANPEDGRYYIIMNASVTDITIGNETGTAANQIVTGTGAAFTFKAGTSIAAVYDGGSSKWRLSGGAGGAGGGTTDVITQVGHGFAVGDAVYLAGLVYTHAIATAANTAEVVGVVSKVVSNDAFELTLSGEISGLTGLTPGEVYFLGVNPATPGKLTIVEPSVVGQVSLPVGVASSASTLYVAPKRGVVVGAANARTTISIANNSATSVVSVTDYNSLKLEGELNVTRSSGGNQRAYYTVEAAKNGAGVWQVSASYTGDDVLYTTLPSWDVASNNLQVTMPLVTNFSSASLTYALNAPAVGASLPLAIDSSALNIVDSAPLSYRNVLINGNFDIWQRGTSAANSGANIGSYPSADRWKFLTHTSGVGWTDGTLTQSTDTPSVDVKYSVKAVSTSAALDDVVIFQNIEGANAQSLAGKQATLSFWYKKGGGLATAKTFKYAVRYLNSLDVGTNAPLTMDLTTLIQEATISSASMSNTWAKVTMTVTVPSQAANGLCVEFRLDDDNLGSGDLLFLSGVQLEVGSKSSAFERRPIQQEIAMCQRYFEKSYDINIAPGTASVLLGQFYHLGSSDSSGSVGPYIQFRVTKRSAPIFTAYTDLGLAGSWGYARNGAAGVVVVTTMFVGQSGGLAYLNCGANWVPASVNGHWTASAEL